MARNLFRFFSENNPVRGTGKTNNIPDVNWLNKCTLSTSHHGEVWHNVMSQVNSYIILAKSKKSLI